MQNKLIICLLCLVTSYWSCNALGDIYRWVDDEGHTHYGDKPSRADKAEDITEQVEDRNVYTSVIGETFFTPFKNNHGLDVTKYFTREDHGTPLPFTSYSLQEPLLPDARLLKMLHRKDSIWIASDIGLLQFSKLDEQWYLYDRRTKLPGDTVNDLTLDGNRLLLKIYDGKHTLTNLQHISFDVERNRFEKSRKTFDQARAGGSYTVRNSDILSNTVFNVLRYEGKVWLTTGALKGGTDNWTGGVSVLKPLTKRGKQYTVRDGLAHPYCYDITASENNSVWVTHWKPERGLSVLNKYSRKWNQLKTSRNDVELGGVTIAAAGHYILIGQQRALVIYDKRSGLAFELDEASGMPGRIVSDITVDDEYIWVSAYTYTNKGSSRGGLVKIARSELGGLFERMNDEEKELDLDINQ